MQIKVTMFHDESARDSKTDLCKVGTVVVSNGRVTATYTFRELLGGGLKFCVDSQIEFNTHVQDAAIQQFKLDCATVSGKETYTVVAGNYEIVDGVSEKNVKFCASYSTMDEVEIAIDKFQLAAYPFCDIETNH